MSVWLTQWFLTGGLVKWAAHPQLWASPPQEPVQGGRCIPQWKAGRRINGELGLVLRIQGGLVCTGCVSLSLPELISFRKSPRPLQIVHLYLWPKVLSHHTKQENSTRQAGCLLPCGTGDHAAHTGDDPRRSQTGSTEAPGFPGNASPAGRESSHFSELPIRVGCDNTSAKEKKHLLGEDPEPSLSLRVNHLKWRSISKKYFFLLLSKKWKTSRICQVVRLHECEKVCYVYICVCLCV